MGKKNNQCPEFPYFGARYPDAKCIDGYLWDLDKCDGDMLYGGGEEPCPFCNSKTFIEQNLDPENGNTVESLTGYISKMKERYA